MSCLTRPAWLTALALVVIACDPRAPVVSAGDPDVPGPYAVGITTFTMTNVEGQDEVPVEVWYPAAKKGDTLGTYDLLGVEKAAGGYRDATPSRTAPLFLVGFSHGLGGIRQQNYSMAERLASYGFVVVAPDHPGTTTLDFINGIGNLALPMARRPGTLIAAVDAIYAGRVKGLDAREEGYALVGHSMGALTSMFVTGGVLSVERYQQACAASPQPSACGLIGPIDASMVDFSKLPKPDKRVVTAVLQSPAGEFAFEPGTIARIPKPFVLGGMKDGFYTDSGALPIFGDLGSGAVLASYRDAGHNCETDICNIGGASLFADECGGTEKGYADPNTIRALSIRHTVAWLGVHLGRQPAFEKYLGPGDGYDWQTK